MLIQCDAAGLEWRILALLSGDQVAIRELNSGADLHSLNQAELQLPSRLIAKIFLFRTIYRGSGWAFAKDNDFKHVSDDPDFWDKKNEGFYSKYWEIDKCHQQWKSRVMNRQSITGPSGREWKIDLKPDGSPPWTTLTNYPVQGTGADLMAIARVSLRNRLKTGKLQSLLINTVHDSVITDSPKEEVPVVAQLMHDTFNDLPKNMLKLWGITTPIAFPCEVKVGHNLGEMLPYGQ
jgi:DNA polymerase I